MTRYSRFPHNEEDPQDPRDLYDFDKIREEIENRNRYDSVKAEGIRDFGSKKVQEIEDAIKVEKFKEELKAARNAAYPDSERVTDLDFRGMEGGSESSTGSIGRLFAQFFLLGIVIVFLFNFCSPQSSQVNPNTSSPGVRLRTN